MNVTGFRYFSYHADEMEPQLSGLEGDFFVSVSIVTTATPFIFMLP